MRPYRGKQLDNGEWVYGYLISPNRIMFWDKDVCMRSESYEVDPATVGQSTGLCDKNGKDLGWYNGDLISKESTKVIYRIFWNEEYGQWYACRTNFVPENNNGSPLYLFAERDFEKIGTIHDKEQENANS